MRKLNPDQSYVVDEVTGCWNWSAGRGRHGYGNPIRINGKRTKPHHIFYERKHGPVPKVLVLDHLCRNPACVNPDHLEPVTAAENTRRGLSTKITVHDAKEIRRLYVIEKRTSSELASQFNLCTSHIHAIITGINWPGVSGILSIKNKNRMGAPKRKLSWQQVEELRRRYADGETSYKVLGCQFGISGEQARRIVRGLQRRDSFASEVSNGDSQHPANGVGSYNSQVHAGLGF